MRPTEIEPTAFEEGTPLRRTSEHWVLLGGAALMLLGLVALGVLLHPDRRGYGTHEQLGLRPCFPLVAWNVPCPGCGVTTSVTHAVKGDLLGALETQPFGLLIAAGAVVFIVWAGVSHVRGRDLWLALQRPDWSRWVPLALCAMALSWVYKIAVVRGWI